MDLKTSCKENVVTVEITIDKEEINKPVYLISDVHFDSKLCDRALLKRHLDDALKEDALIIIGGDWFDAMQGKIDPRRNLDALRPEYRTEKYFDVVVEDSAKFLSPYAKNIIAVTQGNHELAVRRNYNTDLADRLVFNLKLYDSPAVTGFWKGWVRFLLRHNKRQGNIKMYYAHGASGAFSPTTKGVSAVSRQATYEPDGDIVWNGDTHTAYILPIARERLSNKGIVYNDIAWYLRTPGYKRDWFDNDGYSAQKGLGPNPIGCAKITLHFGNLGFPSVDAELKITA